MDRLHFRLPRKQTQCSCCCRRLRERMIPSVCHVKVQHSFNGFPLRKICRAQVYSNSANAKIDTHVTQWALDIAATLDYRVVAEFGLCDDGRNNFSHFFLSILLCSQHWRGILAANTFLRHNRKLCDGIEQYELTHPVYWLPCRPIPKLADHN